VCLRADFVAPEHDVAGQGLLKLGKNPSGARADLTDGIGLRFGVACHEPGNLAHLERGILQVPPILRRYEPSV
jgi:hypothetical protein